MAKEKRNHVQTASLFGLTVWYRIEIRKGYETIILSYRTDEGKIIYEAQPVRVKNWTKRLDELGMKKQRSKLRLEKLIDPDRKTDEEKAIVNFCKGIVGRDNYDNAGTDCRATEELTAYLSMRRKIRVTETIPLSVILLADREDYIFYSTDKQKPPGENTVTDRKKAISTLLKYEGSTPWKKVSPQSCARWFNNLSEHMQNDVVRLLQNIFSVQKMLDSDLDDPWENQTRKKNKQRSHGSLVKSQIEILSLSDGQCREIVGNCIENCRSGKANLTEFAVLLLMTVIISANELCALNFSDFSYLRDYRRRLVMRIEKESFKPNGSKYYKQRQFEKQYQMRYVPLTHIVAEYFEALKSKAESSLTNITGDEVPVFYGSRKTLHMRPNDLEKSIRQYMEPWMPKQLSTTKKMHLISAVKLLQNTAEQHMSASGYEAEEIRRMKGAAPQLTSAKHYQDFANEAELNKLGSLTDLWISNVYPYLPQGPQTKNKAGREKLLLPDEFGGKTYTEICIKMKAMDPGQLAKQKTSFCISALHGFTGTITHHFTENSEES